MNNQGCTARLCFTLGLKANIKIITCMHWQYKHEVCCLPDVLSGCLHWLNSHFFSLVFGLANVKVHLYSHHSMHPVHQLLWRFIPTYERPPQGALEGKLAFEHNRIATNRLISPSATTSWHCHRATRGDIILAVMMHVMTQKQGETNKTDWHALQPHHWSLAAVEFPAEPLG